MNSRFVSLKTQCPTETPRQFERLLNELLLVNKEVTA